MNQLVVVPSQNQSEGEVQFYGGIAGASSVHAANYAENGFKKEENMKWSSKTSKKGEKFPAFI